ncbi:MAG: hypothetical protein NTX51_06255, partial [Verrucomicrobia bacterium]|nr:hypothetical protein [Verrucomicrobiota bacterium]
TNVVPEVVERTSIVYVTNAASGAVSGYVAREAVATNLVLAVMTSLGPVFYTNIVQVPITNLVARPEAGVRRSRVGALLTLLSGRELAF